MARTKELGALALVLAMLLQAAVGADHIVGGSDGWQIPPSPSTYQDWAKSQTFSLGDNLVFNFADTIHNVLMVTGSNYDSCNTASPLAEYTKSPAKIALNSTGEWFYICGVPGHCDAGQQVSVGVFAVSTPTPPSS